jgi:hypothetical protein
MSSRRALVLRLFLVVLYRDGVAPKAFASVHSTVMIVRISLPLALFFAISQHLAGVTFKTTE